MKISRSTQLAFSVWFMVATITFLYLIARSLENIAASHQAQTAALVKIAYYDDDDEPYISATVADPDDVDEPDEPIDEEGDE